MDDLKEKLAATQERRAHLKALLAERSAVAEQAQVLLAQDSTYPRKRRDIESELSAAEMDLGWIQRDLSGLTDRIRLLEADLGEMMAREVEFTAAAAKAKVKPGKSTTPPGGVEDHRAADARA